MAVSTDSIALDRGYFRQTVNERVHVIPGEMVCIKIGHPIDDLLIQVYFPGLILLK